MVTSALYFAVKIISLQLYPAYSCFKALRAKDTQQYLPFLIHFIVATAFLSGEYLADLFLFWIPFYYEVKLVLLLWITLPQTKGSVVVYADMLEPFLISHENQIDKTLNRIQTSTKQTIAVYGRQLLHTIRALIMDALRKIQSSASDQQRQEAQAAAAAAAEAEAEQERAASANNGWYPYLVSFVNRGVQLSERFQQQQQEPPEFGGSLSTATTTATATGTGTGIDRSESYDSLASLVLPRKPSSVSSGPTTSNAGDETSSTVPSAPGTSSSSESWGAYLGSFVWRPKTE